MPHTSRGRSVKSTHCKHSASFWKAHIKTWQSSGLSRAEYCREHRLPYNALTYWYAKFRDEQQDFSISNAIVPVLSLQPSSTTATSPVTIRYR